MCLRNIRKHNQSCKEMTLFFDPFSSLRSYSQSTSCQGARPHSNDSRSAASCFGRWLIWLFVGWTGNPACPGLASSLQRLCMWKELKVLIKGQTTANSLFFRHHFSGATCGINCLPSFQASEWGLNCNHAQVLLPWQAHVLLEGHSHSPPPFLCLRLFPHFSFLSSISLLEAISYDRW